MQPELKLKVVTFGKASMSSPCKKRCNETALSVEKQNEQNETALSVEKTKTSSRRTNNIEALSERSGSLQINEGASTDKYKPTDTEMSGTPAPGAAVASKNV